MGISSLGVFTTYCLIRGSYSLLCKDIRYATSCSNICYKHCSKCVFFLVVLVPCTANENGF